jgi:MurNAc alpha-1-phosphate uridylyltransferase
MRPLTDTCPKPLLPVRGKPLMHWHLDALAHGGVDRVVVNTAWLGTQISARFGDIFAPERTSFLSNELSKKEQVDLRYSNEGQDFGCALETAGGIARALPSLGDVFWVLAGDVFAPDFVFDPAAVARFAASDKLAHLWLVPNPAHNPRGDFGLQTSPEGAPALALNLAAYDPRPRWTYSTIGLYRQALFRPPWCDIAPGNPAGVKAALAPLLRTAMDCQQVSAEIYQGAWTDVGTPERLAELNATPNPP